MKYIKYEIDKKKVIEEMDGAVAGGGVSAAIGGMSSAPMISGGEAPISMGGKLKKSKILKDSYK